MRSITRRRTVTLTAAAAALVLALCGCVPDETLPSTAPPTSSEEAPFANDDQALESARQAYEEYLKVTDQIIADGGQSPERVDPLVTAELADTEKQGFQDFRDRSMRSVGNSQLAGLTLQEYQPDARNGVSILTIYTCVDISGVDVLDANGKSVVSADRPDTSAFEVTLDLDRSAPHGLRVSSNEPWTGTGPC
jgi:hypothetical protein